MKRLIPIVIGAVTSAVLGILFLPNYLIPALSPRPEILGVTSSRLSPCPSTPNCVSSQATGGYAAMQPIPYAADLETARARLLSILRSSEGFTLIDISRPNYIYAEARTPFWKFIDDVEFYFDDENKLIHFRSAARLGDGDIGVNRQRMEQIIRQFQG